MVMMDPAKLRTGTLERGKHLSLLIPAKKDDEWFLVGRGARDEEAAVFLTGPYAWCMLPIKGQVEYSGFFVDNARVEVDTASARAIDEGGDVMGALFIHGARWHVRTNGSPNPSYVRASLLSLTPEDAEKSEDGARIAFTSWAIVTGEGRDKQVLWKCGVASEAVK